MAVRVVVTGVDREGVSSVERDGPMAAEVTLSSVGGMVLTYTWQAGVAPGAGAGGSAHLARTGRGAAGDGGGCPRPGRRRRVVPAATGVAELRRVRASA